MTPCIDVYYYFVFLNATILSINTGVNAIALDRVNNMEYWNLVLDLILTLRTLQPEALRSWRLGAWSERHVTVTAPRRSWHLHDFEIPITTQHSSGLASLLRQEHEI